jgi:hypothetical protein
MKQSGAVHIGALSPQDLVAYASSKSAAAIIYNLHTLFFLDYIKCVTTYT